MLTRTIVVGVAAVLALSGCGNGRSSSGGDVGHPGNGAQASRTIDVRMDDNLRFDPSTIDVRRGETVTFRIANVGAQTHEFALGDDGFQSRHDKEMLAAAAGRSNVHVRDEPFAVNVEPGQTKQLTWTFPATATTVVFACHQPGHYIAGMRGDIRVG